MKMADCLPSFDNVAELLTCSSAYMSPSEMHGLLCGAICVGVDKPKREWLATVLGNEESGIPDAVVEAIHDLYESTVEQLESFDFSFQLLLPDDDNSLELRIDSLGLWCQGFLIGLSLGVDNNASDDFSSDIQEALKDIADLSRINEFDFSDQDEEDEISFTELNEYIRLAVLMIFTDMAVTEKEKVIH